MNYAIFTLENQARILKGIDEDVKDLLETAKALKEKKQVSFMPEVVYTLLIETRYAIVKGLDNWGEGFSDAKKRQIKKLEEVDEALFFLTDKKQEVEIRPVIDWDLLLNRDN